MIRYRPKKYPTNKDLKLGCYYLTEVNNIDIFFSAKKEIIFILHFFNSNGYIKKLPDKSLPEILEFRVIVTQIPFISFQPKKNIQVYEKSKIINLTSLEDFFELLNLLDLKENIGPLTIETRDAQVKKYSSNFRNFHYQQEVCEISVTNTSPRESTIWEKFTSLIPRT